MLLHTLAQNPLHKKCVECQGPKNNMGVLLNSSGQSTFGQPRSHIPPLLDKDAFAAAGRALQKDFPFKPKKGSSSNLLCHVCREMSAPGMQLAPCLAETSGQGTPSPPELAGAAGASPAAAEAQGPECAAGPSANESVEGHWCFLFVGMEGTRVWRNEKTTVANLTSVCLHFREAACFPFGRTASEWIWPFLGFERSVVQHTSDRPRLIGSNK